MPRKTHVHHKHREQHKSEEGFISEGVKSQSGKSGFASVFMSKNEKVVMGILIGGILIFLIISIIILYSRSRQVGHLPTTQENPLKSKVTPYPTIPPIENMTIIVNNRRFNPQEAKIPRGGYVQFLNMADTPITIEAEDARSSLLNIGSLQPSETTEVTFNESGVYNYRNRQNPDQVGRIIVE